MPSPSTSLATQRPELASLVELDLQATHAGFIGHMMYPVFDVPEQAGNFGRIPLNELMQSGKTERAPGAGYERDDFNFIPESYATEEHGREAPIDDRERRMYRNYLDGDMVATVRAVDKVLRAAEKRIRDSVYDNIPAGQKTTVGTAWDQAASDPLGDVEDAVIKIRNRTGMDANTLQLEWETFKRLRNNEQLVERCKYQGYLDARARQVTVAAMSQFFDLDYIVVSGAGTVLNSANQGQAAASLVGLWDRTKAIVCRTAMTNDFREPCIGRTFHWMGDGSMINGTVESYREEHVRSDIIRVRHDVDEKSLYPECAEMLEGVLT